MPITDAYQDTLPNVITNEESPQPWPYIVATIILIYTTHFMYTHLQTTDHLFFYPSTRPCCPLHSLVLVLVLILSMVALVVEILFENLLTDWLLLLLLLPLTS